MVVDTCEERKEKKKERRERRNVDYQQATCSTLLSSFFFFFVFFFFFRILHVCIYIYKLRCYCLIVGLSSSIQFSLPIYTAARPLTDKKKRTFRFVDLFPASPRETERNATHLCTFFFSFSFFFFSSS